MGNDSDLPSGRQRRSARRAPTREEWQLIASEPMQRLIWWCVTQFLKRYPSADPADAYGRALDEVIVGVVDFIPEAGLRLEAYLRRRILWWLGRERWERRKRMEILGERRDHVVVDPPLASSWEMMAAAERLQLHSVVAEAIEALPFDHQHIVREHYFRGRTIKELAAGLGMSASAGNRLHRDALARLRAEMVKRGIADTH